MKKIFILVCMFICGCSRGFNFSPYTSESYETRKTPQQVIIYLKAPSEKYKTIGIADFDYYQPGFSSPTLTEAFPQLKEYVSKVGGDAAIVNDTKTGLGFDRNIRIVAEVIRFD